MGNLLPCGGQAGGALTLEGATDCVDGSIEDLDHPDLSGEGDTLMIDWYFAYSNGDAEGNDRMECSAEGSTGSREQWNRWYASFTFDERGTAFEGERNETSCDGSGNIRGELR